VTCDCDSSLITWELSWKWETSSNLYFFLEFPANEARAIPGFIFPKNGFDWFKFNKRGTLGPNCVLSLAGFSKDRAMSLRTPRGPQVGPLPNHCWSVLLSPEKA
jgi:hypothetical protein